MMSRSNAGASATIHWGSNITTQSFHKSDVGEVSGQVRGDSTANPKQNPSLVDRSRPFLVKVQLQKFE